MQVKENNPTAVIIAATSRDSIEAAALLIFTKNTRLEMSPGGLAATKKRCTEEPEWMENELAYMSKTIRSSWEFLDITFAIRGVTRACAQQITRTRFTPIDGDIFGSYAMQSQRVTDMRDVEVRIPPRTAANAEAKVTFEAAVKGIEADYNEMIKNGVSLEDARGILPMNACCNLIAKYNLRNLADLVAARTSYRAQDEYQEIARQMRAATIAMWPWTTVFFQPQEVLAQSVLVELEAFLRDAEIRNADRQNIDWHKARILVAKARDQLLNKK